MKLNKIYRCGGNMIGHGHRCAIIGLENSNRYVVQDDHVCDRWER